MNKPNILLLPTKEIHRADFNRPDGSGMDEKSLGELAASIKEKGVVVPLIVKKRNGGGFDLIAGERRWSAAKLLKLTDVPCIVREVKDDAEWRELNIIENLQREGLHPIEEARGYKDLLTIPDSKTGKPLHTMETLAKKVGKSIEYVYARLKLIKMPEIAQAAMYSGKLNHSVALLLCRIPDPKLAHKATLEVLDRYGQGTGDEREKAALNPDTDPMSVRQAKSHIQDKYMIRLKGAPFDQEDANLVPVDPPAELKSAPPGSVHANGADGSVVRQRGGKCSDCPWRTGNLKKLFPVLYGDCESADVCTNPACFRAKKEATQRAETAKYRDKGQSLLSPTKAREILNYEGTELTAAAQSEYVNLRDPVPGKKGKTWEDIIGEHLPEDTTPLVAKGKKTLLLVDVDTAAKAAKAAGIKFEPPKAEPDWRQRQDAEEAKAKQRKVYAAEALDLTYKEIQSAFATLKSLSDWEPLLRLALRQTATDDYAERHSLKNTDEAIEKHVHKLEGKQLIAGLVEALFCSNPIKWQGQFEDTFLTLCSALKLDPEAHFKQVEAKAKEQAKADEAKAKAQAKAKEEAQAKADEAKAKAEPKPEPKK